MKRYFLDTSIIIGYIAGKPEILELVRGLDGERVSNYICLAELYEGVYRRRDPAQERKVIKVFYESLNKVYNMDYETADTFGRIRADLRKRGQLPGDMDILIAATCLTHGLVLVTNNKKHFERIESLEIYTPK